MERLKGAITDILFSNEENGYTVAKISIDGETETVTGIMPGITIGETVELEGRWDIHNIYGRQFRADRVNISVPTTISGIISFLSSGVIRGIGEKMAIRIVEKFEESTLDVIRDTPEKLLEIEGIGKKKLAPIIESFQENMGVRNIIMELSEFGITPKICMRIYKRYRDRAIPIIRENPYRLAEEVYGIGFKIADHIGMSYGIERDSVFRIEQGVLHCLNNALKSGHVFLPEEILVREASNILELDRSLVEKELFEMAINSKVVVEKYGETNVVYLPKYYMMELEVTKKIIDMAIYEVENTSMNLDAHLDDIQSSSNIHLAPEQIQAVKLAFKSRIMVLTGGPGTGKTTTINAIIQMFDRNGSKVSLAAPTGRAAKRMTETTNHEASTIHRLLEMSFNVDDMAVFSRDEDEPIEADVVIVDEASMIDLNLMYSLLNAIGPKTRLIMVGDSDQLPSVGAGNVLRDIISSKVVDTVMLNQIFRQAQKSDIVVNAHRINNGEDIVANRKGGDFFFISRSGDEDIMDEIKSLMSGRLSRYYNIDSLKDIQILSAMRKGEVGVKTLNLELQKILNPHKTSATEIELKTRTFRVGDKVMQIKNNYTKSWENENSTESGDGIYNGDIGYVYHIDKSNEEIYIQFDEEKIFKYKYDELDEIEHCFCTTVHKSQGSEFPIVIMPMVWGPPSFLSRNLIYTAVTRAKKAVILVGEKKYLDHMIKNNINNDRYTNLSHRLSDFRMFEIGDENF